MNKFNNLLAFILVYITIFLSGDVKYEVNDKISLIICFLFVSTIFLLKYINKKISSKSIVILWGMAMGLAFTMVFNKDVNNAYSYFGIIMRSIMAFFIIHLVTFESFSKIYRKIIGFLAITSLLFFIIGVIDTNFRFIFPVIEDSVKQRYGNAIFYSYNLTSFLPVLYRNNGIFNEAGVYQVFLNIALMLELKENKFINKKYILILVITIITTKSTVGYIILIIILLNNILYMNNNSLIKKYILIGCILMLGLSSSFLTIIVDKFDNNNISYVRRNLDMKIDGELICLNPILGVGIGEYREKFPEKLSYYSFDGKGLGSELSSSSNSLTRSIAIHGIVFSIFLIMMYINFIIKYISYNIFSFILISITFISIFSSQGFFISTFFLSFAFYGVVRKQ